MRIRNVAIRRYRSVENAGLANCGGLNILIGKNNSGKSNILSTIDLMHRHLARAALAGPWQTSRPGDEFTDRDSGSPLQIAIEFDLSPGINSVLRERLQAELPHLEKSIDQLRAHDAITFVLAGVRSPSGPFLFTQHIAAGRLVFDSTPLITEGITLLAVPQASAQELFALHQESSGLRSDVRAIDSILSDPSRFSFLVESRERPRYYLESMFGPDIRSALVRQLTQMLSPGTPADEVRTRLSAILAEDRDKLEALDHREIETPLTAFAGTSRTSPAYATWLMKQYGSMPLLHLKETRDAIGKEEAEALLTLKVTRGGPERLLTVQRTVKSLLGVQVDAFQADEPRRPQGRGAEMDIDQFLVEANGAGVREALRLILDLELKKPELVLIEEPEVHLHPGLEHAVYTYLRDKSPGIQMFVTTHSTNFVDSVSFQNIYLVSRGADRRTGCQALDQGEGPLRIPTELGLRLSTVFMYDRLVFVEGPSDEAVLRELARILDLDLAKENVGFVQMGGIRNFAHFAAQATLDLLARRSIRLSFIADRDERDDAEVADMLARLGGTATLRVLERRELENYLTCPRAFAAFVGEKQIAAGVAPTAPSETDITSALKESALALKDTVIRLRIARETLRSLHLQGRQYTGSPTERIDQALVELGRRRDALAETERLVTDDVAGSWNTQAPYRAPGSLILDGAAQRFGVRFKKESGDSARLARQMRYDEVPTELSTVLRQMVTT